MARGLGINQRKILLLLLGGIAMGLSRNPRGYFRIANGIKNGLERIDYQSLTDSIKQLYKSKLVSEKVGKNGSLTLILTEQGKQKALTYNIDKIGIKKPSTWDKKWRVVMFDVPEKQKRVRDAIRHHLKRMDFFEFQKSVFVHPYNCLNEMDFIIEFYNARKFVRFIVADSLDNELHLKKHFDLI